MVILLFPSGLNDVDLKTANILIDYENTDKYKQNPTAILSDFGLAGILDSFAELKAREKNPLVGISLQYAAPEVIKAFDSPAITVDDLGSPESDVYSFGMVFYEIICRTPPFSHVENTDVLKSKILKGERPWFTVAVREQLPEMISVIENCWRKDPSDRYSSFTPIIRSLSG
jgi:serine/threonine protein kinase